MNENLCLLSTTRSFKTVYSIKLQFHKGMKPSLAAGQSPPPPPPRDKNRWWGGVCVDGARPPFLLLFHKGMKPSLAAGQSPPPPPECQKAVYG